MKFGFLMRIHRMVTMAKLYVIFMHTQSSSVFCIDRIESEQKPTLAHTKSIQEFYVS